MKMGTIPEMYRCKLCGNGTMRLERRRTCARCATLYSNGEQLMLLDAIARITRAYPERTEAWLTQKLQQVIKGRLISEELLETALREEFGL